MRAIHRIIGCTLCLAFVGSAAAVSLGTPGVDNATHAVTTRSSHGSDRSDGDTVGINHDSGAISNSDSTTGPSGDGNDHSGAASSAPAPSPRPHLGWQSLLPGSIQ
ncbi:MAG: hypothetical protein ABI178_10495 [Rhodanobacter sp.]